MWNASYSSQRIPIEREIWRDLERTTLATRLRRMEKGVLPNSLEQLQSEGYIGHQVPPDGYEYGYIVQNTGPSSKKITIFAGTDKNDISSVRKDWREITMIFIVE